MSANLTKDSDFDLVETGKPMKLARRRTPRWRKMSPASYITLALVALLSVFPFYWMFIVASNGNEEVSKVPPT